MDDCHGEGLPGLIILVVFLVRKFVPGRKFVPENSFSGRIGQITFLQLITSCQNPSNFFTVIRFVVFDTVLVGSVNVRPKFEDVAATRAIVP